MAVPNRRWRSGLTALLAAGLLALPARALEPVFSNDDQGATRDVKVCILLLQATGWENTEPFFLPALAGDQYQRIRNLRPSNWNLVNPLASSVVTPAQAMLWSAQTGPDAAGIGEYVVFDGVAANVDNDWYGNGNATAANVNANNGAYNSGGTPPNPGGPNTYRAHCNPVTLAQIGSGPVVPGLGTIAGVPRLPAVGQPLPKTHPAYWEVPLTPVTVSQLANFDAVFVNTHRNLRFTPEEQVLLRQFLDQGGTLFLEDSHGCRMEVAAGTPTADYVRPEFVDFFLPFQFVDGFPWATGTAGQRPDFYPINRGGVSTITPSKSVPSTARNHPLLNILHKISAAEADRIGDVRARDHLIIRSASSVYRIEEVLRCANTDAQWGNPTGTLEPALAVARVGSGKLILSGVDAVDDCAKPFETNQEPTADWLPDIKLMFNIMAWKAGSGGDRRGGANNQGVATATPPSTLLPRFVWHHSRNWSGPTATDFNQIDAQTANATALQNDPNYLLKEPLAAANGIVYVQYQDNGNYWLAAVDANPETDLDGDGDPDDGERNATTPAVGVREIERFGAPSDTIWRRDLGGEPVIGGTVTSILHEAKKIPTDVLIVNQVVNATTVRVRALHASVNRALNATAPVDVPGNDFYNWTGAAGSVWGAATSGYVDLDCQGQIFDTGDANDTAQPPVGPPVVYDDHVYLTAASNFGVTITISGASTYTVTAPPGEWAKVFALRSVPDPGRSLPAGLVSWTFPDTASYPNERPADMDFSWSAPELAKASIGNNALKLSDNFLEPDPATLQLVPNFLRIGAGGPVDRHAWPATAGANASPVVPTMVDTTNLTPVISLAKDRRTGLTAPVVFLNRTNGDVWAVTAAPEALGWRISKEILRGGANEPTVVLQARQPGAPAAAPQTLVNDTDVFFNAVRDSTGAIIGTNVQLAPNVYRTVHPYSVVSLTYFTPGGGPASSEQKLVYPRQRLLRGHRLSGYSALGDAQPVELLSYSTGAPMVLDPTTVVATSTSRWRQPYEPSTIGSGYQVWASGQVSFFDATADAQNPGDPETNQFGAVRWVFDPGILLSDSLATLGTIGGNLGTRRTFSVYGSPVKYGSSVVVAGAVHSPEAAGRAIQQGGVIAVDPNPLLVGIFALAGLDKTQPVYVCSANPTGFAGTNLVTPPDATHVGAYVVDPRQYVIDFAPAGGSVHRLQIRAREAHLTRLANPLGVVAGVQLPEALPLPLYGRRLWLVRDANGDGLWNDGAANLVEVYIPAPVKWSALYRTVLLDARELVNPASIQVRRRGGTTLLAAGTDYTVDTERPLLTFAPALIPTGGNDPNQQYLDVTVAYQTVTGATYQEDHRVFGPMPGFSFAPVVAGQRLYVSGTQMGTRAAPALPPTLAATGAQWANTPTGGVYSFAYGAVDHLVDRTFLRPDTVPGWPNFNDGVASSYCRGIPLVMDGQAFVSLGIQGDGTGTGSDAGDLVAPLFALGASHLLVTEGQRVARVDYEGRIAVQFTGTKEKIGTNRDQDLVTNNPRPTDLETVTLSRPSRAYNLPGENVLLVDTGNNRVVVCDKAGLVLWPTDSRTGHPDNTLRYLGLRNLGLNRPRDAVRFSYTAPVHPRSLFDANGDGTVNAADLVEKDATVIADTGNRRVVMAVSYPVGPRFWDNQNVQSGTYTYYEPLAQTQAGFGDPWPLTPQQIYNPTTGKWVELPWTQLQLWDPNATDQDSRYDAAATDGDRYLVARIEGSDQLFNLDPDPNNDGNFDNDGDGVVDGLERNLGNLLDNWSGGMVFRGLRSFHRFRVGETPYLAVVMSEGTSSGAFQVVVYQHNALAPPAGPLVPVWTFTRSDYRQEVYDNTTTNQSYYERAGVPFAVRFDQWFAGGAKCWNPVAVTKLPHQNLLAIVNGAANSVNQTGSASEVLIVRFDPSDPTIKRVDHMLPDLSTTSTYPAGQAASRRRPDTGSYAISSPVDVHQ